VRRIPAVSGQHFPLPLFQEPGDRFRGQPLSAARMGFKILELNNFPVDQFQDEPVLPAAKRFHQIVDQAFVAVFVTVEKAKPRIEAALQKKGQQPPKKEVRRKIQQAVPWIVTLAGNPTVDMPGGAGPIIDEAEHGPRSGPLVTEQLLAGSNGWD